MDDLTKKNTAGGSGTTVRLDADVYDEMRKIREDQPRSLRGKVSLTTLASVVWREYRREHEVADLLEAILGETPPSETADLGISLVLERQQHKDLLTSPVSTSTIPQSGNNKWEIALIQLEEIKDSDDEEVQNAILSNLTVFARTVRQSERKIAVVSDAKAGTDIVGEAETVIEDSATARGGASAARERADATAEESERDRADHSGDQRRVAGKRGPDGGTGGGD